ncbi:MAG: formylglycine-generating enzyme family protein [Deltaproteobacteria bacterium]|nr:formylglycine-generating enzyme family protein [Deltaproteobacteria bacterium]
MRAIGALVLTSFILYTCAHEHTNPCDPKSDNYNFDRSTFQKYSDMAWVKIPKGNTCGYLIDKFENSLSDASSESPGIDQNKASKSVASLMPASCITFEKAKELCQKADKRICKKSEWLTACRGGFFDDPTSKKLRDDDTYKKYTNPYQFPYTRPKTDSLEPITEKYIPGVCNDLEYAKNKNKYNPSNTADYACSNKERKIATTPAGSLYGEGDVPGCWVSRTFTVNSEINGVPAGTYSYIEIFDPNSTYTGIFDMSGNLYEWVEDDDGKGIVIGGSFNSNKDSQLKCDESSIDKSRDPSKPYPDVGFRCCRDIDK